MPVTGVSSGLMIPGPPGRVYYGHDSDSEPAAAAGRLSRPALAGESSWDIKGLNLIYYSSRARAFGTGRAAAAAAQANDPT